MKTFTEMLKTFWADEAGMEMSEYAVVGVLICLGCVAAFTTLANDISNGIGRIGTVVTGT